MRKSKPNAKETALFKQIAPVELRKGEIRKLQIVQACIESLAKSGWQGTNYESVGKLCGMKRPHVAYHYPQWSELLEAAIKFAYGTGQAIVSEHLKGAKAGEEFQSYVAGTFQWLTDYPQHHAVVTLLWHLATIEPRFAALYAEIKRFGTERVFACLFGEAAQGTHDPRWQTALAVHGMMVGRCVELFSQKPVPSSASIIEEICASAHTLSAAPRPTKPRRRK